MEHHVCIPIDMLAVIGVIAGGCLALWLSMRDLLRY